MQWKSRKLWVTASLSIMLYVGPILYKQNEISDNVTLWALGAVAAIGSAYLGFNVLNKKVSQHEE